MKKITLVLLAGMLALGACKKNNSNDRYNAGYADGQSDANVNSIKAAAFLTQLYSDFGSTSFSYNEVKIAQDNRNFVVFDQISGGTHTYFAVHVSSYTAGTGVYNYFHTGNNFINLTSNGDGTYSCGAGCGTYASGGSFSPTTSSLVFEETSDVSKDIEKAAAFVEQLKTEKLSEGLVAKFGLSEGRAVEVARLAQSWEKISKSRAMTDSDADHFTKEIMGANMADIEDAAKDAVSGSTDRLNNLIDKAAEVNGVSPEQMNQIVKGLFF